LAIGGQPRPGAVAHEEPAIQLLLQVLHPRGDGGLGDMQAVGGGNEAAGADDLQEGTRQVDIHGLARVLKGRPSLPAGASCRVMLCCVVLCAGASLLAKDRARTVREQARSYVSRSVAETHPTGRNRVRGQGCRSNRALPLSISKGAEKCSWTIFQAPPRLT